MPHLLRKTIVILSAAFAIAAFPPAFADTNADTTTDANAALTPAALAQIGATLEKAAQCQDNDWEEQQDHIPGSAFSTSDAFDSETTLPPGIKIFGYDVWKVRELETGASFFLVYLRATNMDAQDMAQLAKKLRLHAHAWSANIVETEDLPITRYDRIIVRGQRAKNGDLLGADKIMQLSTVLSNGQHYVAIGCMTDNGDPG